MNDSLTAKRVRPADALAYGTIYLCAFFSVALLAVLLGYVLVRGIGVINWQFLTIDIGASCLRIPSCGAECKLACIVDTCCLHSLRCSTC